MPATPGTSAAERFHKDFVKGIWKENPVFVQLLGMCPTLAVTNSAQNALAMGLATTFVLLGSSFLVSSCRRFIPSQVRISVYIVIIATFVTVADYLLQAFTPGIHKDLGAFIALIVVNCIILGRQEAFAAHQPVRLAVADALGMGAGFTLGLLCLGAVRELLGAGSLFGVSLLGASWEPWVVMVLPPGGFLVMGVLMLVFNRLRFGAGGPARARAGGAR
jgi:electron transport complex protein RnfE